RLFAFFFFQAEDGIRVRNVTGVQTCALPISGFSCIMELQGGAEMVHSISDVQSILTPIFDRYGISRAVLFGSVAKGTATAKSDQIGRASCRERVKMLEAEVRDKTKRTMK